MGKLRQQDKKISQLCGFKAECIDCNERKGWNFAKMKSHHYYACCESEDELWDMFCPHWSTDIESALELTVRQDGKKIYPMVWKVKKNWYAKYSLTMPIDTKDGYKADSPSEAICKAWLAEMDK